MSGHDWQAIGSTAGAVGLLLALYTFLTDRLQRRIADVELRFEQTQHLDPKGKPHTTSLMVVHNHGPRKATDVRVTYRDRAGQVQQPLRGASEQGPLEVVWPGQEYTEPVRRPLGMDLHDAEVEWSDGRFGRQRRRYLVSFRRV